MMNPFHYCHPLLHRFFLRIVCESLLLNLNLALQTSCSIWAIWACDAILNLCTKASFVIGLQCQVKTNHAAVTTCMCVHDFINSVRVEIEHLQVSLKITANVFTKPNHSNQHRDLPIKMQKPKTCNLSKLTRLDVGQKVARPRKSYRCCPRIHVEGIQPLVHGI